MNDRGRFPVVNDPSAGLIESGRAGARLTGEEQRGFVHRFARVGEQDDVVVGAIFVNQIDRAGIVCGLIRDGINVANFKEALLDDNFGYLSLPPKLRRERLDTLGVKQC